MSFSQLQLSVFEGGLEGNVRATCVFVVAMSFSSFLALFVFVLRPKLQNRNLFGFGAEIRFLEQVLDRRRAELRRAEMSGDEKKKLRWSEETREKR